MVEQHILDKIEQWGKWEKSNNLQLELEIEQFKRAIQTPLTLLWTGDSRRSSQLLDQYLNSDIFYNFHSIIGGITFRLNYGDNISYTASFQGMNPREINEQTLKLLLTETEGPWKIARAQLSEVKITLPNKILEYLSIEYTPWLGTRPNEKKSDDHPWVFVSLGSIVPTREIEKYMQDLIKSKKVQQWIEGEHTSKLNTDDFETIKGDELRKITNGILSNNTTAIYVERQFFNYIEAPLNYLFNEVYKFQKDSKAHIEYRSIELLEKEETFKKNIERLTQSMNSIEQLRNSIVEWNQLKLIDVPTITKALQELQKITKILGDKHIQSKFSELQNYWEQHFFSEYAEYHHNYARYVQDAKEAHAELKSLSFKWHEVKNPKFMMGKINSYAHEVELYNNKANSLLKTSDALKKEQKKMLNYLQKFQQDLNVLLNSIHLYITGNLQKQHRNYQMYVQKELQNINLKPTQLNEVLEETNRWETSLTFVQELFGFQRFKQGPYYENAKNLYDNIEKLLNDEPLQRAKKLLATLHVKSEIDQQQVTGPSIYLAELSIDSRKYLPEPISFRLNTYIENLLIRRSKYKTAIVLFVIFVVGTIAFGKEGNTFAFFDSEESKPNEYYDDNYEANEVEDYYEDYSSSEVIEEEMIYEVTYEQLYQHVIDFRNAYLYALNNRDFTSIEPYLATNSSAYIELEEYIENLSGSYYFDFYENNPYSVENTNGNYYDVTAYESFDFTDSEGTVTYYEREKIYTIEAIGIGDFEIESISILNTIREIQEEPMSTDVVEIEDEVSYVDPYGWEYSNEDIEQFLQKYYTDFVDAYNGAGFENVSWAYNVSAYQIEADELYINEALKNNLLMTNSTFTIYQINNFGDLIDVYVEIENYYTDPSGEVTHENLNNRLFAIRPVDGSFEISRIYDF